jgi:hypothetical protein
VGFVSHCECVAQVLSTVSSKANPGIFIIGYLRVDMGMDGERGRRRALGGGREMYRRCMWGSLKKYAGLTVQRCLNVMHSRDETPILSIRKGGLIVVVNLAISCSATINRCKMIYIMHIRFSVIINTMHKNT